MCMNFILIIQTLQQGRDVKDLFGLDSKPRACVLVIESTFAHTQKQKDLGEQQQQQQKTL